MKFVEFKFGELFSGPGGLALAAMYSKVKNNKHTYSIVHQWANDFDKDSCETYRNNICPENKMSVTCKDVRNLDITKLEKIDALAFGFPCNDFSIVGKQKGINGAFGSLYSYGVKAVKFFKPKWFLAENVAGLRSANDGKTFETILDKLHGLGYSVTPHLYKFEEYGVPQARHRIIMVGIRNDIDLEFRVPMPTKVTVTSREAIEDPPISQEAANNEFTKQSAQVIERLSYIKPGENVFNADLPKSLQLNIKGAKLSHIYKRLDPDKPAYTITGSGGGGTHVYHWSENRALTNRERARLQTFPDKFIFHGSKESVRKQVGMAVPVKGAKVVFEAILKTFAGIDYPYVEPNMMPRVKHNKLKTAQV